MTSKVKIFFSVALAFISVLYSPGYSQIYSFTNFGTADGLPQSSANCIAQDSTGYLWIGTWQGVSRFNGTHFNNDCLGTGIPDNVVISLEFDSEQNLWMGTRSAGAAKYSGTGWTYFNYESGVSGSVYTEVLPASNGRIWFYNYDGGISVLDGDEWSYYNTGKGFIGDYVVDLYEDRSENIWAATMSGLARFDGEEWRYWTTDDGLPDNQVLSVLEDIDGNIWVGTIAGLYVLENGNLEKGKIVKEAGKRVFSCMIEDRHRDLWFGTINGLVKYSGKTWQVFDESNGLADNKIKSLLEDREGNIWIGHLSSGLTRFSNHAVSYYDRKTGLSNNHVRAFAEDKQGNFWIGTHTNGVSVLTEKGWRYPAGADGKLRERTILDLLVDSAGRVLIGTFYGVYIIDGDKNYLLSTDEGLFDNDCYGLYETSEGEILTFTTSGAFSLKNGRFEKFPLGRFDDEQVAMFDAIEDREGNLWINSQYDGLYVRKKGSWKNITRADGLASNSINSISVDSTGNLWFTTLEDGVTVYDGAEFKTYTEEDGLLEKNTNFAVHMADYTFIGTNKGVSIYNAKGFKSLTIADGLPSNETNRNASIVDTEGNVWIGTISGAVRFTPDQYTVTNTPPVVKIDKVLKFSGKSIARGDQLEHSDHLLSFNYSAIYYSNPKGIRYSVRLRGLSDNWHTVNTTTQQYVNLPHGKYEFQVRAQSSDGIWSENPVTFNFEILTPFWMKWWFVLMVGVVTLSIAWLIVNFIYRHNKEKALSAKNKELEQAIHNLNREVDIRLSVENALRLSESRYRVLFEQLHDAAFVADIETGILVQVNKQAEKLTGYSRGELIGMHQKYLHPDNANYEKKFKENINEDIGYDTIDADIRTKDGKIVPVQILSSVIELDGKKTAIGLFRDITVFKENEQVRLLEEKRLNAQLELLQMYEKPIDEILNFALNISVELTESKIGFLGFVNEDQTVLELHSRSNIGIDECEVENSPVCFSVDDSGLWSEAILKREVVIVNDYSADFDGKKGMPEGHLPLNNFVGVPLVQDDRVVCLVCVANKDTDYTDSDTRQISLLLETMWQLYKRKLVENELRYNESMLRTVFENVPVSIMILDRDGTVEYINKALPGIYQSEIVGKKITSLCCREFEDKFNNSIREVLENGENISFELETESNEGDQRYISIVLSPARRNDNINSIIMVASDITARNNLEEEKNKASKLESISILAGGIAHDFNNILTAILGNISLAKMLSNSSEEIVEILSEAEKASMRAKDLTRQLLTFSKGGETIRRTTSLKDVISVAAGFALRGTNATFSLNTEDDLWDISADESQINQVISNLVLNAQESMPDGGTVEIFAENANITGIQGGRSKDNRYVKIIVADKGSGISNEDLPRIFDPYFTTKSSGSGLGLSITYNIVNRHGGHISVDSNPGEGTKMKIYLPVAKDKEMTENIDAEQVEEMSLDGRRVLVLEDEEFVGRMVKRILEKFGCRVELTRTGDEAVEWYSGSISEEDKFEVVIIDLAIKGGMDGSQTIKELIKIDPDVVAIVSSAYSDEQTVTDYASYGFKDAVTKPYIVDELKRALLKIFQ